MSTQTVDLASWWRAEVIRERKERKKRTESREVRFRPDPKPVVKDVLLVCECGIQFQPYRNQRFCSRVCGDNYNRKLLSKRMGEIRDRHRVTDFTQPDYSKMTPDAAQVMRNEMERYSR